MISLGLSTEGNLYLKHHHQEEDDGLGKKVARPTSEITFQVDETGCSKNSGSNAINRNEGSDSEKKSETKSSRRKFLAGMVFGHAPTADEILGSFSNPGAAFAAKFFQTILYSISNVIFASNLLSGLFILITMSFSAPFPSVLLGILSLLSGLFTCLWIVRFPREMTIRGGITFNCFLVGSLLSPLTGLKTSSILSHEMIYLIPMALAVGAFTIFIWGGLNGTLAQANIPVLNAPCNILGLLVLLSGLKEILAIQHPHENTPLSILSLSPLVNGTNQLQQYEMEYLNSSQHSRLHTFESKENQTCLKILGGAIKAQGQIFQTADSMIASSFIWLSVLIYSPILFFQELVGATLGTLIGSVFSDKPAEVCNGSWGFNPLLTSGALGGFFIAFNFQSFILSIVASILTSLCQAALIQSGLPVLGIPFMITTWLLLPLAVLSDDDARDEIELQDESYSYTLYRVKNFTTPEINQRCWVFKSVITHKYLRPRSTVLPL